MPVFSPGEADDVVAAEEKPPNEGVMLVPLVSPLRPPFPKPENAVVPPLAAAAAAVKANPLKPLKAPVLSPCNKYIQEYTQVLRLNIFLIINKEK